MEANASPRRAALPSSAAQVLAREVVEAQRHAVHNAVRGEAWTEFLLYANGFTVDDVKLAIGTFNRHLGRDNTETELRSSPGYAALRAVLARTRCRRRTEPVRPWFGGGSFARFRRGMRAGADRNTEPNRFLA